MAWRTCNAASSKSGLRPSSPSRAAGCRGGSVPTITSESTPIESAGRIGVFRRVPPSQYQPLASLGSWIRLGGKRTGIELEAMTWSVASCAGT